MKSKKPKPPVVCTHCQKVITSLDYYDRMAKIKKVLAKAKRVNNNSFVKSCSNFFTKRGYLTDKQIAALEGVKESFEYHYIDLPDWE